MTVYIQDLYGLKQAGRCWYFKLKVFLEKLGFIRLGKFDTIFIIKKEKISIGIFVDDILIFAKDKIKVLKLIDQFKLEFEFKENLYINTYISINIVKKDNCYYLDQKLKLKSYNKSIKS
jgi:hypothetical protein